MPLAANPLDSPWAPYVIFPLFVLIMVTLSVTSHRLARRSFQTMLEGVARKLNGNAIPSPNFSLYGTLEFKHRGFPVNLRFLAQQHRMVYTQFEIRWCGPRFRCEIYPEDVVTRLRKLLGMKDIVIGAPQFDEAFLISGDRPAEIASFLTPHMQYAIFDLADPDRVGIHQSKRIRVSISPDSLQVTRNCLIDDSVKLLEFIRQCVELAELAVSAEQWGIEFLDPSSASTVPHCMVCGEPLVRDVVQCRRCQTPHHRECWSYCGGCSTYGCREKVFLEPPPMTKAG